MRRLVGVLGMLALSAASVRAQSLGVSGVYVIPTGSDFDGTHAGFGVQGLLRFAVSPVVSLGLGMQWTSHPVDNISANSHLLGVVAEPRYTFAVKQSVRPYFMGTVTYVPTYGVTATAAEYGGNPGDPDLTLSTHGFLFGVGAGLLIDAGTSTSFDLSAMYGAVNLSDFTAKAGGQSATLSGTSASGGALQLRAGLLFRLGR
jgi:hypothetical protein